MNDKVKKSLAAIRHELARIPQQALDDFIESMQRHSYSAHLDAHHSLRSIFGSGGACSKTDLLVVSGRDKTDNSGKVTLPISSLLCGALTEGIPFGGSLVLIREPNLVATPLSSTPSFATVVTNSTRQAVQAGVILNDRDSNPVEDQILIDVTAEVRTWKPDGSSAANTAFSWICTIEAARLIFVGG